MLVNSDVINSNMPKANIVGNIFGGVEIPGVGFLYVVISKHHVKGSSYVYNRVINVINSKSGLGDGRSVAIFGFMKSQSIRMPYVYNDSENKIQVATDSDGNPIYKENFILDYVDGPMGMFDEEIDDTRHDTKCFGNLNVDTPIMLVPNSKLKTFGATFDGIKVKGCMTNSYHENYIIQGANNYIIGHLESNESPVENLPEWFGPNNETAYIIQLTHRVVIEALPFSNQKSKFVQMNNNQAFSQNMVQEHMRTRATDGEHVGTTMQINDYSSNRI